MKTWHNHDYRYRLYVIQQIGSCLGFLYGENRTSRLLRGRALAAQHMQKIIEQSTNRIVDNLFP